MAEDNLSKTDRSRLKRMHARGHYDRETVYKIIDEVPFCHAAYIIDDKPYITPTLHWREGDRLYWHGSSASRFLRKAADTDVTIAISSFDGYVLARSGFHTSVNFRSVVLFGKAEIVEDEQKELHMKQFMEQLFPGRWDQLRPVHTQEMKGTTLLSIPIEEGTAKIRTSQPEDDAEDYDLPVWAGILPARLVFEDAIPDPRNLEGVELPGYLKNFRLGQKK